MRFPHVLLMIPLFLVLWCTTAMAGEDVLPDPTASLHPTDNIVALAKLRPLLAKSPDDQHLLGLALMCYVNLCLAGEPETDGGDGPWLGYASALMERRSAARRGALPASLDEEAPELWVRLVRGERAAVLDALARHEKKEQAAPMFRSLRILASTDWRSFKHAAPSTRHERYTALRVGFETNVRSWMDAANNERAQNPAVVCEMNWRGNRWGDPQTIIRETIAFTAWMLASRDVEDAVAKDLLLDLGTAVEAVVEPALERQELWRRVTSACERLRGTQIAPLTTAMRACDRLIDRPHGLMAADGSLQLYGLGDLAAWNRDRLYIAMFYSHLLQRQKTRDYPTSDRVLGAAIRKALPGSVIAARYTLGNQGISFADNDRPAPEAWDALARALTEEMDRPRHHAIGPLAVALNKLSISRADLATPLLQRLVAEQPQKLLPRAHLQRLVEAAQRCDQMPLVMPSLRHWTMQAPSDHELQKLMRQWSPTTTMVPLEGRKPFRSWIDPQIDNRTLPWPTLELSQWFAIRWQGDLRIDRPGVYRIAVESDDGSRLVVDDVVIDNSGDHAMQVKGADVDLAAGWFPVRLEFLQGSGEAGCRLLWQPPGAPALTPIPAANLAHGPDHAPGLMADGFNQAAENGQPLPNAAEIAYARGMPWHLNIQERLGQMWFDAGRYPEAAEIFRLIMPQSSNAFYPRRLHQCLLWGDPPDVDGAIALMRKYPAVSTDGPELTYTTSRLRKAGRLQEVVDAIGEHNRDDVIWPFVRGYAALDRGDLRTARDEFAKLLGEGGPGDRYIPNLDLGLIRMEWAVLNRLDGKETNWAEVERGLQRNGGVKPWQELTLDWLSSAASWEECVQRVPMVEDGDDLYYFQGLVALTSGDHATAKMRFQELVTKHPNWMQAPTCHALLKWYESQTPESLAKVATAKPINPSAGKPAKPRSDANDF